LPQQHNLVLVHDFPYVDLVFDDAAAPRFCKPTQKNVSIEFFTYPSLQHGRLPRWLRHCRQLIRALGQVKAAVDFNQYRGF